MIFKKAHRSKRATERPPELQKIVEFLAPFVKKVLTKSKMREDKKGFSSA
jgi:hypothetical protein